MRSKGAPSCSTGREDYHARIDDPELEHRREHAAVHARRRPGRLSGRGRGGEHAAARLRCSSSGITALPCIGDGRQSGTSGSPSILNASPEAAIGGGLALLAPATACASTSTARPPTS